MSSTPPYPRLQRGKPISDGLVGCWRFYEGSGLIAHDISGKSNHGTLDGPTWSGGREGYSLSFDGTDDYVDAGSIASIRTVSAWFKHDDPFKNHSRVYSWQDNRHTAFISAGGVITFYYNNALMGTFTPLSTGQWYHIVGTLDGTTFRAYINGVERVTKTSVTANDVAITFRIGKISSAGQNFDGQIDDVRIYHRGLSAREIALIYSCHG